MSHNQHLTQYVTIYVNPAAPFQLKTIIALRQLQMEYEMKKWE